jgi:hypothetical protein
MLRSGSIGMRAVMLNGDEWNVERFCELLSVEGGLIFRMRVTEQSLRRDPGGRKKAIDGGPIAGEGFWMCRVTDVLGKA